MNIDELARMAADANANPFRGAFYDACTPARIAALCRVAEEAKRMVFLRGPSIQLQKSLRDLEATP